MRFKNPGLKLKILTLILILISSAAIMLIYRTYSKLLNDIYIKNSEVFQTFTNSFHSEKDTIIKKYSMSLDILLENRAIVLSFKNRDREKLRAQVLDLYNGRLKHVYDIEQFQFHVPPATSFFRAHAPDQFGDDLSLFRKTVVEANRDKNMVAGLEVGRAGLGLRVVKPVWLNYDFLGTVEFGGNIENLLATPAHSTEVDYAVGVFIEALQRSKSFIKEKNRYSYKNMYLYNYSSNVIKSLITSGKFDNEREIIPFGDKYYMVKNIPLKDFSTDLIGYLLVSKDTTADVVSMHSELLNQAVLIASFALMAILLISFALIKLIFDPLERITNHITSVMPDHEIPKNPIVINDNSEISMLANAYNVLNSKLTESFDKINIQINEIQNINTSLEKRVQERTTQLEATNSRLKNAMAEIRMSNEAKSDFLASMSHEIRTPMNAVLGLSYLMMQTELTSKQYDYISKIRNSANLLLEIINDVLDFSKIEAGKLELEHSPFNLKEIIAKLVDMLEVSVSKKNVSLILNMDNAIPEYLFGDPLRITQVLNNLGTNAAKFTNEGYINFTAKLLTQNETYAKIKIIVADTGIGIPAANIPTLFDSFTQVKRKEQKKHVGSGLGLSISKKILDAMNSDISVQSIEGEGSTFTFTLTLEIADKNDLEYVKENEQKFEGKRILICERKEERLHDITSFFRENLADVLAVSNQTELLKHLRNNIDSNGTIQFDLIVMDTCTINENTLMSLNEMVSKEKQSFCPPIIILSDENSGCADITSKMTNLRIFIIPCDIFQERIPALANDLLTFDNVTRPDIEYFKRSKVNNSGIKVLIVDDNDLNLQVITEFADILGLSYKTAKNGYEAVKALENEEFDIVFMDIIMPEMDGITATNLIRKSSKYGDVPIYALSASTMQADIEKCRKAGMNGHIAKPVKIHDITLAIKDCSNKQTLNTNSEAAQDNTLVPESDEVLNTDAAISYLNGSKSLYYNIIKKYYKEYAGLNAKADGIIFSNTPDKIKNFFHTIKGVARTIGADKLSDASEKLEQIAINNPSISKSDAYAQFKEAAAEIELKLRSFFHENNE